MIVCADDYGLRQDIDEAILDLVRDRRLTAVSCLVALERCDPPLLAQMRAHQAEVDIGLHLCFTDEALPLEPLLASPGEPRHMPAYGKLLRDSLTGKLSADAMADRISTQYHLFMSKCGRRPDFIDGHLHTHQLPGIRAGLLRFLAELAPGDRPYIRNTALPLRRLWRRRLPWAKAALIIAFGRTMAHALRKAGIRTNHQFAGIYDFRNWQRFPAYVQRFAACLSDVNGMLVTHPGLDEEWRLSEFETLSGGALSGFQVNRFRT
jgi:predicted glycoside hydrolase/deacetylase ChbG (UPF0249 family)